MKETFDQLSAQHSRAVTAMYSTSFSSGVSLLHKSMRDPIHAIYGFVRLADEIVDSFHDYDQQHLLNTFVSDTWDAIEQGISLNPILNSFQRVVNQYDIDHVYIQLFLKSMTTDLDKILFNQEELDSYILGSAEVVGLMCLTIFTEGDKNLFSRLEPYAKKLGSAFQKVNFLRDIKDDVEHLGRMYFPHIKFSGLTDKAKAEIELEILSDFEEAMVGINQLPFKCKLGVYTAYVYYRSLLRRIMKVPASRLFHERIRVSNLNKLTLMLSSKTKYNLGLV